MACTRAQLVISIVVASATGVLAFVNATTVVPPAEPRHPERLIEELQRAYRTSATVTERRAVAIRAIEEGVINAIDPYEVPVGVVDRIFGTKRVGADLFATTALDTAWQVEWDSCPARTESLRVVDFTADLPVAEGVTNSIRYLVVSAYLSGKISWYWLGNCLRSDDLCPTRAFPREVSRLPDGSQPARVDSPADSQSASAEYGKLNQKYRRASTPGARRAVLLTAVDEGLIREGGPLRAMNEIFGRRCGAGSRSRICEIEFFGIHETVGDWHARRKEYKAKRWWFRADYDAKDRIGCYKLGNLPDK